MTLDSEESRGLTRDGDMSAESTKPDCDIAETIQSTEHVYIYRKPSATSRYALLFTIFNCCIGSGLLAIPKVVSVSGFVVAACYDVIALTFCTYCFLLITEVNYHGNFASARELARNLYGKAFMWSVDISVLACILPITYVSISADYIRTSLITLAGLTVLESQMWSVTFKVIIGAGIIFPLTIPRSISALNIVSSFAVVFVIFAFIVLNVRFFGWFTTGNLNGQHHVAPPVPWFPESTNYIADIISYYTIFSTLYSLHASITPIQFDITGSPRYKTRSMKLTILIILPIVTVIYAAAAIEGSLMFNRNCPDPSVVDCIPVNSNILLSFTGDTVISVVMFLYSIVILTSFPVMLYPIRANILAWFKIDKYTRRGYGLFILVGFILTVVCTTLAILIPNIDKVLSIMGNVFGVIIFQLFPLMVVYKLPLLKKNSVGDILEEKLKRALHEQSLGAKQSNIDGVEFGSAPMKNESGDEIDEESGSKKKKQRLRKTKKGSAKSTSALKENEISIRYRMLDLSKAHHKPHLCIRVMFYTTAVILVLFNASAAVCEVVLLFRKT
ncbi:Amino acid transporter [Giardia duodenalis]|uniref:Amino acid transporter n=1 Tax=Giardia intestinalis TaxID=5741 RepID=V6TH29_GIAIN|nr:Amino acid transporter [Giardia intestinalis]